MRDDLIFVAMLKKAGIEYHKLIVTDQGKRQLLITFMDGPHGATFVFADDGSLVSVFVSEGA